MVGYELSLLLRQILQLDLPLQLGYRLSIIEGPVELLNSPFYLPHLLLVLRCLTTDQDFLCVLVNQRFEVIFAEYRNNIA